jgi:small Trp-rich protein
MWLLVLGVLLIALKLADFSTVAAWSWWAVLSPFGGAVLWWAYADSSGLTKRREMDKLGEKKLERRRKNMEALGIGREQQKTVDAATRARRAAEQRAEGGRAKARERNEQVIKDSVIDSRRSTGFDELKDPKPKS